MTGHPDPAELNDLLDGDVGATRRQTLMAHLESCTECASRLAELEQLTRAARELPRRIATPPDTWALIRRATIRGRRVRPRQGTRLGAGALLAATALLTVGVALGLARGDISRSGGRDVEGAMADSALAVAEATYRREAPMMLDAIGAEFMRMRPPLQSEIVQYLSTTQEAIAIARVALEQDSANPQVKRILAATYQGQLRMLRRTMAAHRES